MRFDFTEIDRIINARSIAIVGASNNPGKFGYLFPLSQISMGFTGRMYLVNPREKEIMGREAFPDILSLPEVPELVYLTVPAHLSMDVLRECAGTGVRGVVMIASGFREVGESGQRLEAEALELAREGGFRIIGPNCFGIYNPRNHLTLLPGHDFSTTPGDVAFISQSGGFSAHVARLGRSLGIHFSAVVSYGNAADLDETDFLRYFTEDRETEIIAGYLEGVGNGQQFAAALEKAAAMKPVVLWKVGKGESAGKAIVSHTGSLAGSSEIWESLMRQCGVIEASGVDDLCDSIIALKSMGRNPGRKLLVSGGGGGLGTYGADLAEEAGLEVPPLAGDTFSRMSEVLGRAGAVAGNPMDIGAPLIPLPAFESAIGEAATNPTTDILVFDLALNFAYGLAGEEGLEMAVDILIEAAQRGGKPMVVVLYSRSCDPGDLGFEEVLRRLRARLTHAGVAVYPSMERAIRAISRVNTAPCC